MASRRRTWHQDRGPGARRPTTRLYGLMASSPAAASQVAVDACPPIVGASLIVHRHSRLLVSRTLMTRHRRAAQAGHTCSPQRHVCVTHPLAIHPRSANRACAQAVRHRPHLVPRLRIWRHRHAPACDTLTALELLAWDFLLLSSHPLIMALRSPMLTLPRYPLALTTCCAANLLY